MNTLLNMNTEWLFSRGDYGNGFSYDFDDRKFADITIPHTMRLEKKFIGGYQNSFVGIGWYRKYFDIDKKYRGKKITLEFDGIMMDSDVYLNGSLIYTRNGGYIGFSVDITDIVDFENENLLAVRVSNFDNADTPPGKELKDLDFYYYGGIYRPVRMKITDKLYITNELAADKTASGGIFVSYPQADSNKATVKIDTHIQNDYDEGKLAQLRHRILWENEEVKAFTSSAEEISTHSDKVFTADITVENPHLWHPDTPNLYTLETELLTDNTVIYKDIKKIGIRYFEMKPNGLYINGNRLFLRGGNRHQCYIFVGDAAPASMQYRDAVQMKENGFNSVRACHYPQSPEFLSACDEIGLLVIACQPGWQKFTETDTFYQRTIRDIKEMIRRDRNHPSIFLWETSLNETVCPKEWSADAVKTAHNEMPGTQMFTSNDYNLNGEFYDVVYKGFNKEKDGTYTPKSPEKASFTREWGDLGGYNQAMRNNTKVMLSLQLKTHQRFLNDNDTHHNDWGGLDANEKLGGYFLWSWNDYSRGYNDRALGSGTVEIDRVEKPLYYYLKSMTDPRNAAYGPMVYIDNFHSFIPKSKISVYSNCDRVSLYADKKEIKTLTREDMLETGLNENIMRNGGSPIFLFDAPFKYCKKLTAKGYLGEKAVVEHTITKPCLPYKIKIKPDFKGIRPVADGSDLVPVYFYAVDKNGMVINSFYGKIKVSVEGEGELVGKNIPRIEKDVSKLAAGIGFAFIRTASTAGKITVSANGYGILKSDSVTFDTEKYDGEFVTSKKNHRTDRGVDTLENGLDNAKGSKKAQYKAVPNRQIKALTCTCGSVKGRELSKLFDGKTSVGTGWLADTQTLPQSVIIELKNPTNIIGTQLYWEKDGSWYRYNLDFSRDGMNWESIISSNFVGGQNFAPVIFDKAYEKVKYIRLSVTDVVSGDGETRIGVAEWRIFKK